MLYFVLSKAGIDKVFLIMKGMNPLAFISAIFIYIFSLYVSTIRWRLLLPEGFRTGRLFSLYLIGSFFNTFLPGVIGGDAVKAYYLSKELRVTSDELKEQDSGSEQNSKLNPSPITHHSSLTISIASVFMDRYIGFIALMSVGLIAFPFGFKYFKGSNIGWLLLLIVFSFLMVSLLIFWLRLGKGIRALSDFYDYFHAYKNQRNVIVKTLLLSAIIQIMGIMAVHILTMGLGQHISLLVFFIFIPIIITIATLPISISGIGLREGSFVLLFGFLGITPDMATAISFAWFLSIASGSLLGLVEYIRHSDYFKR